MNRPHRMRSGAFASIAGAMLLASLTPIASSQDLAFARAEGASAESGGAACQTLADGSVLVAGTYYQTAVFGAGGSNEVTLTTDLNRGVYVTKHAPDGSLQWARNVGALRPNSGWAALYVQDMKVAANGDYTLVGHMTNTVRFGAGTPTQTDVGSTFNNFFVAAFAADGSLRYARAIESNTLVTDHTLAIDSTGGCYVGGRYYSYRSTKPTVFGNGVTIPASTSNGYDMFLVRYSSTGLPLWAVRMTSSSSCTSRALEVSGDGSVLFAGDFVRGGTSPGLVIGNSTTPLAIVDNAGGSDIALIRFDPNGAVLWAKGVGGNGADRASSLSLTSDGGFYLAGSFYHHTTLARGETNEVTYTDPSLQWAVARIFFARYSADGSLIHSTPIYAQAWHRQSIATMPDDGAALTATFQGTVVLGATTPQETTLTHPLYKYGHMLATFAADGSFRWARSMRRDDDSSTLPFNNAPDVCVATDGSLFVTGNFVNEMHFNEGLTDSATIATTPSGSASNAFLARYFDGDGLVLNVPGDIATICDDSQQHATVNFVVEIVGTPPAGSRLVITNTTTNTLLLDTVATSGQHGVSALQLGHGAYSIDVRILDGTSEVLAETFTITVEDKTAPVLHGCVDRTIECSGPTTTLFRSLLGITATDDCDPTPQVTFVPSAVSMGTTPVTVRASDDAGNTSQCTVLVTVVDTTAPSFTVVPVDIVRECTGMSGTSVSFDIQAEDICGPVQITCRDQTDRVVNPSGTLFTDGSHTITCRATDAAGNWREVDFMVIVEDNTQPVVVTPDDIVVGNDPGECFARVPFTVTATDLCDPNVAVTTKVGDVVVFSGDAFPVGTSTVTVTAMDKAQNMTIKQFHVTVEDREAPVIDAPASKTIATDCKGSLLTIDASTLSVTANDNCGGSTAVSVTPNVLSPGTHVVALVSIDAAGNLAQSTMTVTVMKGAFDCTVLRPLDPNVDNRIQPGRIIPIKLRTSCENAEVTDGLTVVIDQIVEVNSAGTPIDNVVVADAQLGADAGSDFRLVDSHWHFNLRTTSWSNVSGTRHRIDVRVQKLGHVDTIYSIFVVNR